MTLAFYKVDNSKGYDYLTFVGKEKEEVKEMLSQLGDEELSMYDMNNEYDRKYFQYDYNEDKLDGGWWCVVLND